MVVAAGCETMVIFVPTFKVKEGQVEAFKKICVEGFIAKVKEGIANKAEKGCVHYHFTCSGNTFICQEAYDSAEALKAHLVNVDAEVKKALEIAEIVSAQLHGPQSELDKLTDLIKDMNAKTFAMV
ncbi:unnamed protein product [Vitrella brassicaformis CCMP3155]|uniref:ABM domain-containing protein n=1 Tax=Vitrella brassicaformis (strain CCMP3155) TaxID=1169540 RepID=A0A0G4GRB9_VITBC|nr:unnamed protein product [Vitrella brassicaformis CCMP3155]|eukprot:CEM33057.1 unnamed protein product [Vitrella brassicaformis CCMP3155]